MRKILLLFLFLPWLAGATIYVDFTNSEGTSADSNNGTSTSTAWIHCPGDANATGTAASTVLAGGDTVIFKGGVEYAGQIIVSWSGTSNESRITYDGNSAGTWGTGRAIIDGTTLATTAAFSNSAARSWITIKNFEIRNLQYSDYTAGIHLGATTIPNYSVGLVIQDNYIHHIGRWENTWSTGEIQNSSGIHIRQCDSCLITGNTINRVGRTGMQISGGRNNTTISNNDISYICWGILVGNLSTQLGNDHIITGNKIYDTYHYDAAFRGGDGTLHTDFVFIQGGSGYKPTGNIVERNLFYNNYNFFTYGGTAMVFMSYADDTIIRNNVFINPHNARIIQAGWTSAGTKIYNNTFYMPRSGTYATIFTGPPAEITNNLIYSAERFWVFDNSDTMGGLTPANCDRNMWVATGNGRVAESGSPITYYNKTAWQALGYDANSTELADVAAIKFKDTSGYPLACGAMDLSLAEGSPAIGAGTNLYSLFQDDFNGDPRPDGAFTIGAYEGGAGAVEEEPGVGFTLGTGASFNLGTGTFFSLQ